VITEFPVPTSGTGTFGVTAGPDGNVWFTEGNANKIGRINPITEVITEFPVPTAGGFPFGIVAGPDGNLWFVENVGNRIGRITPAGVITEFPFLASGGLHNIAVGPDGNLWFNEYFGNKIGRITPLGVITESPVPTSGSLPYGITAGPDGNVWFTENARNTVGRITTAGVVVEFPRLTGGSTDSITLGPDGNLWFTDQVGNKIVKVTLAPLYNTCLLYDPNKAAKSGATIPMKLQLCDGGGNNLSSSSITVHAVSITQISTSISGPVEDSGNANPDNDFRFDPTLGETGGYVFNLKTTGLTTGTYKLDFVVTGDSARYSAPFQVK
jgi:streptogramin lyase